MVDINYFSGVVGLWQVLDLLDMLGNVRLPLLVEFDRRQEVVF